MRLIRIGGQLKKLIEVACSLHGLRDAVSYE